MRVVIVTPAGRRRYLEILIKYVESLRPIVDEYRLWVNTVDNNDIAFMQLYEKNNPGFVTLEYLPDDAIWNKCNTIFHFFKNCQDPNTLYVRFDDDIVYLDSPTKFTQFLKFRKDNPQYFLVYANTINNAICSHLHQKKGVIDTSKGIAKYDCVDSIGWNSGEFAKLIHNTALNSKDLSEFRMSNWLLTKNERVSINAISWRGDYFHTFDGKVTNDEEIFLACTKPAKDKMYNIIYGDFLCIHYAFYSQRDIVDKDTTILARYRARSLKTNIEN